MTGTNLIMQEMMVLPIKQIKYLEIFGITKSNPNLKKLVGTPLWEVRILGKSSLRIICVAVIHNEVMVLNIFKKKSNKTPLKELSLSISRYSHLKTKCQIL